MSLSFHSAGAWRTADDLWIHAGGAWRRLSKLYRNVGGTWQLVHSIATSAPLAVTASPASYENAFDSRSPGGGRFAITFTASASGGSGSYAGSWSLLSGGGGASVATHSGEGTPSLMLSGSWPQNSNREYSETWRFTVTDSLGATAFFDITLYVSVSNDA